MTQLLSACALAVSVTALVSHAGSRAVAPAPALPSAKLPSDGQQQSAAKLDDKCAVDSGAVVDLAELMEERMNGALTRIAFSLHHDSGDFAGRMERAAACASRMAQFAHLGASFRPNAPLDRLPEYYGQLDLLQGHAYALKTAALEGSLEEARHWYAHLKQSCIHCHERFPID